MLTQKEIQDSMTKVVPRKKSEVNAVSSVRYDENGKSDLSKKKKLTDLESAAIVITNGNNKIYKVKYMRSGHGNMYNPLEKGFRYSLDAVDKLNGELMFKFTEVNEKCFNFYISFLETKNLSRLAIAERELR